CLSLLFTATYFAATPDMNEWLKTGRQSRQRLEPPPRLLRRTR
ncbi:hypothetical protein HMPREF9418_1667, partial [Neisseria macacae ATCC 33926]